MSKLDITEADWFSNDQTNDTAQKIKFSIKDFFSKYDQIRTKLRLWSHLLKKILNGKLNLYMDNVRKFEGREHCMLIHLHEPFDLPRG